ncbi:MAG: exodeoxyribonuclease-3 [Bermanella sp.]|jgi:exodeoxyribonuclease-3
MRVITVQVDGLEAAVKDGFYDWLMDHDADVVCVQNLKAKEYQLTDSVLYPEHFNAYFFDGEPDNYSGVAVLTKNMPKAIMTGLAFEACDRFGRYIQADFDQVSIGSVLFPSIDEYNTLEDKLAFQQEFIEHLKKTKRKRREFIFAGHFGVAHKSVDVFDYKSKQNEPGFLPEEQAFIDQITGPLEFVDAFREANFGENQYTWYPDAEAARRKQHGWRLDYQICTAELRQYIVDAKVLTDRIWGGQYAATLIEYEFD